MDHNLEVYWKEQGTTPHKLPDCFSLEPVIDFAALARSMGIEGIKAETCEAARKAARTMLETGGPFLVDLNTF